MINKDTLFSEVVIGGNCDIKLQTGRHPDHHLESTQEMGTETVKYVIHGVFPTTRVTGYCCNRRSF